MQRESSAGYITRAPRSSGLADVLEILLDRGLVIDAYVRVSLVGIELVTIDLRVVVASVDTYLRFAEAVNRLDLRATDESRSVPELVEELGEGGVVLPARFGIVVPNRAAVVELLRADELGRLLELHRDTAELTLKGSYEEVVFAEFAGGLARLRNAYRAAPTLENGLALGEAAAAALGTRRSRD